VASAIVAGGKPAHGKGVAQTTTLLFNTRGVPLAGRDGARVPMLQAGKRARRWR